MLSLIQHGKRSLELQKWRNLRVSVNFLQKESAFFSSSSSANVVADVSPQGNTFTVSYLVESLGLTTKLAESISRRVCFEDKVNPDSVVNLLTSHGFEDSQISKIIRTYPRLLIEDAETSLRPKLQALQSRGASSSELAEVVSRVPKILEKKEGKSINLYYDSVRDIMQDGELCDSGREGKPVNRIRNISVLRELGVPQKPLFSLLISNCQPVCGKEKFDESLKRVIEMGFDPTKLKFVEALHVVYEMSDKTIQEKVNVYKRLGFSERDVWKIFNKWPYFLKFSEKKIFQTVETLKKCGLVEEEVLSVLKARPQCIRASERKILETVETFLGLGVSRDEFKTMIKRFPHCIAYSAESMKEKFEFLVEKMNWPLEALVLIPTIIGYSMEKRIVPRCNVIRALMSKGLIASVNPPISSVLICTDDAFLKRYVMKHGKLVPELMDIFTGGLVS